MSNAHQKILQNIPDIFFFLYFSESSPSFVTSPSTSPSTTPLGGSAVVQQCTLGSLPPGVSLTKPVPRPLGSSPLFSGPNSLQSLLYRHPYLSGNFPPIATSSTFVMGFYKGQLISKCQFVVFSFFQKPTFLVPM